ncbi:ribonuclease H-like domain-containing protein [Tanacetum coccineum]
MSANDKFGLGYKDHRYDGNLSYENEVLQSVFMNKESDIENQPLYDRFVTAEGMHAVPPPMIGNYMPSGPDIEIDYSQFTYGPKQSQPSESETQTSEFDTCESYCSVETHKSLPEPAVNEPKVVSQPKVWFDAPIIEEYESDSEDEETVKNQFTHSKNPKVDKKGIGYGFTTKTCFVCGSLTHLIRDCDFHEKRMAKQAELNNRMRKKSSQREIRPIWNNAQRINHKNQFVPTAVLTRTGKIPVNTARANGTNNAHDLETRPTLAEYQDFTEWPVAFGGIKTSTFQSLPVCHRCVTRRTRFFSLTLNVLFCPEFKLPDANQVLLRIPRQNNMYSFNLENIVPSGGLACLIAKATIDESNKWHRRLGHVNFKNLNKLVKGNLVRGLPSKIFQNNDHTSLLLVRKERQHKATCNSQLKQDANLSTEALRKEFAQETKDLLLQAGAAKASSTNIVNTASTPVSTFSPYDGLSFTNLTNTDQDDSEMPTLEEIYDNPTIGSHSRESGYSMGKDVKLRRCNSHFAELQAFICSKMKDRIFAGLQNIGSQKWRWDQFGRQQISTSPLAIDLSFSTEEYFNFSKLIL